MSICIDIVYCGAYHYADRVSCNESDPLELLIAAEDHNEEAASGFVSQADVIDHHELRRTP